MVGGVRRDGHVGCQPGAQLRPEPGLSGASLKFTRRSLTKVGQLAEVAGRVTKHQTVDEGPLQVQVGKQSQVMPMPPWIWMTASHSVRPVCEA